MLDLINYLVQQTTGSDQFTIQEHTEDTHTDYIIQADKSIVGMIIGKNGKVIKSIRNIVKMKAVLLDTSVNVSVEEAS